MVAAVERVRCCCCRGCCACSNGRCEGVVEGVVFVVVVDEVLPSKVLLKVVLPFIYSFIRPPVGSGGSVVVLVLLVCVGVRVCVGLLLGCWCRWWRSCRVEQES